MSTVVIFAFDPVDELDGRAGVLVVADELAGRLIAEHRAERVDEYCNDSLRYVTGSAANLEAAAALRGLVGVRRVQVKPKTARTARLER